MPCWRAGARAARARAPGGACRRPIRTRSVRGARVDEQVRGLVTSAAASRAAASGSTGTPRRFVERRARSPASLRRAGSMRSTSTSGRPARYASMRSPVVPSWPSTNTWCFILILARYPRTIGHPAGRRTSNLRHAAGGGSARLQTLLSELHDREAVAARLAALEAAHARARRQLRREHRYPASSSPSRGADARPATAAAAARVLATVPVAGAARPARAPARSGVDGADDRTTCAPPPPPPPPASAIS